MSKIEDYGKSIVKDTAFETVVENAVKIPGVKVNRNEFLTKVFAEEDVDVISILQDGPVAAGCNEAMLTRIAHKLILVRTSATSMVSFAAGIPGGLAMAATIPADTLQFFGMTFKLAQELAYLYGSKDLWKSTDIDDATAKKMLIIYTGAMFGIENSDKAAKALSVGDYENEQIDDVFKPIVTQICKAMNTHMTVDLASKGIAKFIPVIGGIVSGSITFATMQPMGNRLVEALNTAAFHYTESEIKADIEKLASLEIVEVVATQEDAETTVEDADNAETEESVFALIEKLAELKNAGIISDEEFAEKKAELLSRI